MHFAENRGNDAEHLAMLRFAPDRLGLQEIDAAREIRETLIRGAVGAALAGRIGAALALPRV